MTGRKKSTVIVVGVAVVLAGLLLPVVPVAKTVSLNLYHVHYCSPASAACVLSEQYTIRGTSSVLYAVSGTGQPPFPDPYIFETNNTYYCYTVVGNESSVQYSPHPFVNSPLVFSSVQMKANGASFNGTVLTYQVKNEGNSITLGTVVNLGTDWLTHIPGLAPGQTYDGTSTGYLSPLPKAGTMRPMLLDGRLSNGSEFVSVVEVPVN